MKEPQPIPKEDVEAVYDALNASSQALTIAQLQQAVPSLTLEQVHWACGTMQIQDIIRPVKHMRSDRMPASCPFLVVDSFAGYVGMEQAK